MEDGSAVLQLGQRPPLSDTSPPQFGHFITRVRLRAIPARFPLWRLCGWVSKYQSPKGSPTGSNAERRGSERSSARLRLRSATPRTRCGKDGASEEVGQSQIPDTRVVAAIVRVYGGG